MVEGRQPLSEVRRWDMGDVDDFNAILDMRGDYHLAHSNFHEYEAERERSRK